MLEQYPKSGLCQERMFDPLLGRPGLHEAASGEYYFSLVSRTFQQLFRMLSSNEGSVQAMPCVRYRDNTTEDRLQGLRMLQVSVCGRG